MNKDLYNPAPPKVEKFKVEDKEIYVVRDDLCSLFPGPNFSKIRGLHRKLEKLHKAGVKAVASQDTSISRCGWGVSALCQQFDLKHYNFYSQRKVMNFYQRMSRSFGGVMIPIKGTFSSIMRKHGERWLAKNKVEAEFLPIGLSLPETIEEHMRLVKQMQGDLFEGSLFMCVSSGTICAGVTAGIELCGYKPEIYGVMSSRFKNRKEKIIGKIREVYPGLHRKFEKLFLVDAGYAYKEKETGWCPFPCDVYLDRKAWQFMLDGINDFPEPIVFWNIGGEWNPVKGLDKNLYGDGVVGEWDVKRYLRRIENEKI